jgi:hypothetical protein
MILERAPSTTVDYVAASGGTALCVATMYLDVDIIRLLVSVAGAYTHPLQLKVTTFLGTRRVISVYLSAKNGSG